MGERWRWRAALQGAQTRVSGFGRALRLGIASEFVCSFSGSLVFTIPKSEVGGEQPSGNDIDPLGNLWQSIQSTDEVAELAAAPSFAKLDSFAVGVAPSGVTISRAKDVKREQPVG